MCNKFNIQIDSLFASNGIPLAKQFSRDNETDELVKTPFPKEWQLNSIRSEISSIEDLLKVIESTADAGGCLLKGLLDRPLKDESRAGHTDANASTRLLVLDADDMQIEPDEFMGLIGLRDVDYILQYSSSEGITTDAQQEKMNKSPCRYHIFVLLDQLYPAPWLKLWLKHKNLTIPQIRKFASLSKHKIAVKWGLDITVCQNDKLIYVAPPVCKDGIKDTLGNDRIKLIKGSKRVAKLEL